MVVKNAAPLLVLAAGTLWGLMGIFVRTLASFGFTSLEIAGLRILCCVLPGERIVLLGCPMRFHETELEENSMTGVISQHVQDCIAHVEEYLGIDKKVSDATERQIQALECILSDLKNL